jgi:uncharacterized protein YabN with tetrapyrrole methylase and pyrophosphatase domain
MRTVEEAFLRAIQLVRRLRADDGCPWDRAHHFADYLPMLVEEARELREALANEGDADAIRGELGDTIWNALCLLVLAEDELGFKMEQVLHQSCEKIIARHPHIFGSATARTPDEVLQIWRRVKEQKRRATGRRRGPRESARGSGGRAKPRRRRLPKSPPGGLSSS